MRVLKKISLLIAAIVTSTVLLQGCGVKTPTDVVNDYFNKIRKGDMNVAEVFNSTEDSEKEQKDIDSLSEDTQNKVIDKLKEIKCNVNSEVIDGETATVNVTVKGMDFNLVLAKIMQEAFGFMMAQAFSGTEMTDEQSTTYIDGLLNKYIDEVTFSEKTGDISLIKENDEWKIQGDDSLLKLLIGMDSTTFDNSNLNK